MNATGSCSDCKFFLKLPTTDQDGLGECHRFPPKTDALLLGVTQVKDRPVPQFSMVVVPTRTHATNWCGEYAKGLVIPTSGDLRKVKA